MGRVTTTAALVVACATMLVIAAGEMNARQAPPQPGQAGAVGGRGGGRGGVASSLFTAADGNKDGFVARDELKATFEKWFADWGGNESGALTEDQLLTGLNVVFPQPPAGGGRGGPQNQTPDPADLQAMMAALPDKAPAVPKRPRKVLVLGKAAGFVHSSIPLAAKTVEALGSKTSAWSTTITYDPADINAKNLELYGAVFLASTTGAFLDDPNDRIATEARKKALLDFIRGGKGLAAIHAATDSYHGDPAAGRAGTGGGGRGGAGAALAPQMLTDGDKNRDRKINKEELRALADAWFDRLDPEKAGKVSQQDFVQRFASIVPAPVPAQGRGAQAGPPVNVGTWPEFNKLIGGWFKFHWNDPQHITVKIDDPKSPITAAFKGQPYEINDETYTFPQESFSRENIHVLTSIDYAKMSEEDKAKEPAATRRTDGDYGLSWIRREGKGRVFYEAHGHSERIYRITPMLEHILAGIQYALGDLSADDSPSVKPKPGTK